MTPSRSKTHQSHAPRTTGKNSSERRTLRAEFVIRTLKPVTPNSLVPHRQLLARVLFALPVIFAIAGIVLVGLHLLQSLGIAVFAVGLIWIATNFLTGSPGRIVRNLSPAVPQHRGFDQLVNLLESLCVGNGLVTPTVRVIDDRTLNAIVIGWNEGDATLVVTTGLLEGCSRIELEGVIAHELAHIKRGDMRDAAFASVACGFLSLMTDRSATLLNALLSRSREANADLGGVAMTKYPPGLIQALSKITSYRTHPLGLTSRVVRLTASSWFNTLEQAKRKRVARGDLDVQERIGLLAEL
ncbi:MAG TPA: M48 family metalloprotease [Acidimicrobiales bacterium]|nr:M48 family metalloprotease [Acidimicrobiales bacterium]